MIRQFEFEEKGVKASATFSRTDEDTKLNNGKLRFRKKITCLLMVDGIGYYADSIQRPGDKFDIKLGMLISLKKCISKAGENIKTKNKIGIVVPWLMIWHNHYKGLKKKEKKLAKKDLLIKSMSAKILKDS